MSVVHLFVTRPGRTRKVYNALHKDTEYAKHAHAAVLELDRTAPEERFLVLREAERVKEPPRLHIDAYHVLDWAQIEQ
jgi:hypothetical protein